MAVTLRELFGRKFDGVRAERVYWLADATDEDDARTALLSGAAATLEAGGTTLYLDEDGCEVYEQDTFWHGVASYVPLGQATVADASSFEFDTSGGTQHLMASYSTVAAYGVNINGAAANVADNGGLIGVTRDGVEGVDVPVGALSFSITKEKSIAALTATYLDTLADMVGRTNSATFAGTTDDGVDFSYDIGECLFLGARGGVRSGKAPITFLFAAASNKTGLTVGGIAGIAKNAFDYLWIRYADTGTSKTPKGAYVEKVHLSGDFSLLAVT